MPKDKSDERSERELMELYDLRDQLISAVKAAEPDKIAEGQALLRGVEADIEKYEAAIAPVQEASAVLDKALDVRRQKVIDTLKVLDGLEKEPTTPQAARDMIGPTRAETLRFLALDAEERGIPNDDH